MNEIKYEPFNGPRVYQALELCRRDDALTAGDCLTMVALARHISVTSLPGTLQIADTAFPSLATLANASGLDERSIRRSLSRLVPRYFSVSVIPGKMLRGRADHARWDGRRYHLTAIWDEIPTPFDTKKEPKAPAQPRKEDDALHALICELFPDHPDVLGPNPHKELAHACRVMRDASGGDLDAVQAILKHKRDVVRRNAKHLGKYLSKCFGEWWAIYVEVREAMRWLVEDPSEAIEGHYGCDQEEKALRVREWLMSELGPKLQECEVTREGDGFLLTARVRDELRHAHPVQAGDRPHAAEIDWEADD